MKVFEKKWLVLGIVTLVSFITNVDATIVIIGLPSIIEGLHLSMITGLWIITSYLITSTVFLLPAGRWADMVGSKRIFTLGLSIFTIATALCGFAASGTTLILFRLIKGVGAALALSTATPIIMRTFPPNQLGLAVGINSTSWVIGSLAGPIIGGALLGEFGWQSIFFITIPFTLAGVIGAFLVLEETATAQKAKTDWSGIMTFGLGLLALLIAVSEGEAWGWGSARIAALLLIALFMGILFIKIELQSNQPLFDLKLLHNKAYASGLGITVNYCIGYFAITFLLTIYLQGTLQLSPLQSGLLLIPLSAPQLIMGPLGGLLADRFGAVRMMLIGLIVLTLNLCMLGNLGINLSIPSIVTPLLLISVANGLAWPSLAKTVLSSVPQSHAGAASGMFYTIYNVGRSLSQPLAMAAMQFTISSDIISQLLSQRLGLEEQATRILLVDAIDNTFRFTILFFALAILLTSSLIRRQKVNPVK